MLFIIYESLLALVWHLDEFLKHCLICLRGLFDRAQLMISKIYTFINLAVVASNKWFPISDRFSMKLVSILFW